MANSDPLPSIEIASVYSAFASRQFEPSTLANEYRSTDKARAVPDELRASLAGSLRSPEINQAYIERLKAQAEEQAINRRAMRTRSQVDAIGSKASLDLTALKNSPEATTATTNGPLDAVLDAYRANLG